MVIEVGNVGGAIGHGVNPWMCGSDGFAMELFGLGKRGCRG